MTTVLSRSASLSSFTSAFPSAGVLSLHNSSSTIGKENNCTMNSTGEASREAQASTSQQPNQSAAVTATTASSSTARPLKEEKSEPYYHDDSRKAPGPTPEELAQFGCQNPGFRPPLIQKQPTPLSHKLWLDRLAAGNGVSNVGDGASISTAGAGLSRGLGGLVRQRVVQDLQDPEQSQQSTYSSQYSGGSQSLPPLEYITSQESEPYIETPVVTPNGSLHWKDTSHLPIDMLDLHAQISAEDLVGPKRSLSSNSDPLASPPPSTAELTLPSLHSLIPGSPRTRLASEVAVEHEPSRPLKRQRVVSPDSPSPPSRRTTPPGPVSPSQGLDNNLPSGSSTPPPLLLHQPDDTTFVNDVQPQLELNNVGPPACLGREAVFLCSLLRCKPNRERGQTGVEL
ncbi:hypothetical protein DFJ43DRAFT_1169255 [Lentinula guzmanii]|uniref:Uncharacterized protein n=1 Tax=Lentinula guzmanii TaxID=2804957 RepID=A0AA38J642_9AGAR|nr:hypothetical protein DFJ43DRAFT_1169255 [Lentinula guzmanii]